MTSGTATSRRPKCDHLKYFNLTSRMRRMRIGDRDDMLRNDARLELMQID